MHGVIFRDRVVVITKIVGLIQQIDQVVLLVSVCPRMADEQMIGFHVSLLTVGLSKP